jgi:hypothetical protein
MRHLTLIAAVLLLTFAVCADAMAWEAKINTHLERGDVQAAADTARAEQAKALKELKASISETFQSDVEFE